MHLDTFYENKKDLAQYFFADGLMDMPHFHKEIEIVVSLGGESRTVADKNISNITDGDIFIAFPNQIHFYNTTVPGRYLIIIFSPDVVPQMKQLFSENIPLYNKFSFLNTPLEEILNRMIRELSEDDKYFLTKLIGYINIIMSEIIPSLQLCAFNSASASLAKKILHYCADNYSNNISLEVLAKELHTSKFHISHIFHDNFHMSLPDYIAYLRVYSACRLLKTTDGTITEISQVVGFGTIRSFNGAFLKITGTTPSKYKSEPFSDVNITN